MGNWNGGTRFGQKDPEEDIILTGFVANGKGPRNPELPKTPESPETDLHHINRTTKNLSPP